MVKIMFVCHGNICRSPMAEYVLKDMVHRKGLDDSFWIASSATSTEEIGNPIHYGTRQKLAEEHISVKERKAVQLKKTDYENYDYLIGMDSFNLRNILRIIGEDKEHKVFRLLDFADGGDIADPWYTGNFDETYTDVVRGCEAFLKTVLSDCV